MKLRGSAAGWLAAAALAAVAGCGGGGTGSNDQGIVFRANGFFQTLAQIEQDRITCTQPLSVTNSIVDASFNLSMSTARFFPDPNDPFGDPCGGFIGLQNNLAQESINVQEISIRYEIPGASIPVPGPNSISFGQNIPSANSTEDSPSGQPNIIFAQLVGQLVPRTIIVFLNQNVDRLPATPYLMNVFAVARGQSDNGTKYETNEIGYQLTIVP
ncbi:MAG TPA: hypothetical protein VFD92_09560 [Candidatus Binatia bacterium]|nr:hypothetical protein [Candidatus Binatia bacterium]